MNQTQPQSFLNVCKVIRDKALKHWVPLSIISSLILTSIGLLSLYAFLKAIGRVDIFMIAIDSKQALIVWVFSVILITATYITILASITFFFGLLMSSFNSAPKCQGGIALWLLIPIISGFASFIAFIFFSIEAWLGILLSLIILIVVFTLICTNKKFKKMVSYTVHQQNKKKRVKVSTLEVMIISFLYVLIIEFAIFTPMSLILSIYVGDETDKAIFKLAIIILTSFILSLVPIVAFYRTKGDTYKKSIYSTVCFILISLTIITIIPGAISSITYIAAGTLAVRQSEVYTFEVKDDFELSDFHALEWQTQILTNHKIEISAFQLFSFGDALLLCPANLKDIKIKDWPTYSAYCFLTKNSSVLRKPKKIKKPAKHKIFNICMDKDRSILSPSKRYVESQCVTRLNIQY